MSMFSITEDGGVCGRSRFLARFPVDRDLRKEKVKYDIAGTLLNFATLASRLTRNFMKIGTEVVFRPLCIREYSITYLRTKA